MTRILHVLDHSLPLHSGYTFRTRAILKSLRAAGMEVRGITGARHSEDGPPIEQVEGLTFHRVSHIPSGPPGLREWREIESLRKGIERVAADWRPDILHAHSPALCGMAGLRAAREATRNAKAEASAKSGMGSDEDDEDERTQKQIANREKQMARQKAKKNKEMKGGGGRR